MIKRLLIAASIVAAAITASAIGDSPFPVSGGGGSAGTSTAIIDGGVQLVTATGTPQSSVVLNTNVNGGRIYWTDTSQTNGTPGYTDAISTGNRTALITFTTNATGGGCGGATPSNKLFDGDNTTSDQMQLSQSQTVLGLYLRFALPSAKIINQATWTNKQTSTDGTWKWQGCTSAWSGCTDLGSSFTKGGATTEVQNSMSANVTAFQYYQMVGVSGTTANTCSVNAQWYEVDFQIVPVITDPSSVAIKTTSSGSVQTGGVTIGSFGVRPGTVTSLPTCQDPFGSLIAYSKNAGSDIRPCTCMKVDGGSTWEPHAYCQ